MSAKIRQGGVTLVYEEYPPNVDRHGRDPIENSEYAFNTSFEVSSVAARQSSEVYVLGVNGIIEKWTLEIPIGSHYFTMKGYPGVASGPVPQWETGIQGGTYVPVTQRPSELGMVRSVVWAGTLPTLVRGLRVDPEGRYLLFSSWNPRVVYQLSLAPGSSPIVIANETSAPELARSGAGYLAQHSTLGRLLIFECSSPGPAFDRVLLVDADNDGFFESTLNWTQADWVAHGMDGAVWYVPVFTDYLSY